MAKHDAATGSGAQRCRAGTRPVNEGTRVANVELFFDLVFVFAFIELTVLMTDDFSGRGVLNGLLVLGLLWWIWVSFAWLTIRLRANYGLIRLGLLVATAVMFVMAVATRESYNDAPGGLYGPVVFAACYLLARLVLVALRSYAIPQTGARDLLALGAPPLAASAFLFAAALAPQRLFDDPQQANIAQSGLLVAAVVSDYTGLGLPTSGRQINSAQHWSERHGLIVIVALGESIIAIGLSSLDLPISWWLISAAVLGVMVTSTLGWNYFDAVAIAGRRALRQIAPERRVALARDAYSYLHLPMIAGVMVLALGLKKVLELVGESAGRAQLPPLPGLGVYALYGGVILFLLGQAGFQQRIGSTVQTVIWPRLTTAALLAGLTPVAHELPALRALGLLVAVCASLTVVGVVVGDGRRLALREAALAEDREPTDHTPGSSAAP